LTSTFIAEKLRDNPSKTEAQKIIISFLENCDILKTRVASLKAIEQFGIRNKEVYEILENIVISDENSVIRAEAASLIVKDFINYGTHALKYIIENERSLLVIKGLINALKYRNCDISNSLYDKFISKQAKTYLIYPKEMEFLINLECMKETKELGFFKPVIKNNHIIKLDLAGWNLDYLPDSIGHLTHLTSLNLWNNNLSTLPKTFQQLFNLEELFLDWNNFARIPQIDWLRLKSLNKLTLTNNLDLKLDENSFRQLLMQNFSMKYIKEGVNKEDVLALISLEVMIGQKIEKLENKQELNKLYACNYKINESGFITGIYLYGFYSFQIKNIPNEFFTLKYLKELIIRHQNIKQIPKFINNLLSLEKLDLMGNQIEKLPNSLRYLTKLEYLDLEGNNIKEIPDYILNSNINIWL